MIYGSVCSGIEAASVAWEPLGWTPAWFAEVDRAASAVLAYRFPRVINHGDMTKLADMVRARKIVAPDILVGGTPCQAFSIAGLRKGLADARGQLTLAFVDLANAIDEIRHEDGKPPIIIVWENVPGVFTSKDNAFGCFLAGLAGESDPLKPAGLKWTNAGVVLGPERAIAWRTQDAQYHGLAQRRRRVFVVASAGERFDPAAILLEFEGVRRDSPPSRQAGESVAATLDARTEGGGFPGTDGACGGHVVPVAFGGNNQAGPHGRLDFESETFIVHGTQDPCVSTDKAFALGRNNGGENVICFTSKDSVLPFDTTQITSKANYSSPDYGDPCHPLAAGAHAPAIAYAIQERAVCENPLAGPDGAGFRADDCAYTLEARTVPQAICITGEVTHTLKAEGFDASEGGTGRGQPIVACGFQASQSGVRINDVAGTLDANYGARRHNGALVGMAVRRLMPIECERLQGFPDGWTLVPTGRNRGPQMAADGPRYKQIGNSMAVNVMRWIGRRIQAAEEAMRAAA